MGLSDEERTSLKMLAKWPRVGMATETLGEIADLALRLDAEVRRLREAGADGSEGLRLASVEQLRAEMKRRGES